LNNKKEIDKNETKILLMKDKTRKRRPLCTQWRWASLSSACLKYFI